MSIELTIKYTDEEYMDAVRDKIAAMSNKEIHTLLPIALSSIIIALLQFFDFAMTWWGIIVTVFAIVALLYGITSLAMQWAGPRTALFLAKNKKLQETYKFEINEDGISRSSESGEINLTWNQINSVEFLDSSIFFNLKKGSMLIPLARLNDSEIQKLKFFVSTAM